MSLRSIKTTQFSNGTVILSSDCWLHCYHSLQNTAIFTTVAPCSECHHTTRGSPTARRGALVSSGYHYFDCHVDFIDRSEFKHDGKDLNAEKFHEIYY
jgi:hypothetical protein